MSFKVRTLLIAATGLTLGLSGVRATTVPHLAILAPGANVSSPVTPYVTPAVSFTIPRYQLSAEERETLAACLVLEAACQGEFGMRSVMAVIRNRAAAKPELFLPTVLRKHQFSALNALTSGRESLWRTLQRARKDPMWPVALTLVEEAAKESWYDPTGGATHYTRSAERTHWTRRLQKTTTIGAHSFYR